MPQPPPQTTNQYLATAAAFSGQLERPAVQVRNLIQWFVPEKGIVEMYINPQQINYQYKKQITNARTKGGYVLQYWGEELTSLAISGTTGSSGIAGINVLMDVYRNEQVQFDPYALALAADRSRQNEDYSIVGSSTSLSGVLGDIGESIGGTFLDTIANAIESGGSEDTRPAPTLATLAFTVEMYYSNWAFRGYFTDFRIAERANNLGMFDYTMNFMVTQQRGIRPNFFAWHRTPDGPSNSDPILGRPYSYNVLLDEQATSAGRKTTDNVGSLNDKLKTGGSLIPSNFSSLF